MKKEITKWVSRRKWLTVLLFLVVTVLFAAEMATVKAQPWQCTDPIGPGQCYDFLDSAVQQRLYSFYGNAGTCVNIWMEKDGASSGLDPYLELKDPFGSVVAYDDDSGGNGNSWIGGYCLPGGGWHTIVARSYQGTVGTFWLTLQQY